MAIPTIETARLRLRGYRLDDYENCAAMWADANVTRFIGGQPLSATEAWSKLLRYVGHWSLLDYGFWALEEKATGAFVGELGFADWKREMEPAIDVPEAGWVLATAAHGRGYATEALRVGLDWLGGRTICIIHPENSASIRVAEKCGYREVRRLTYKGQPTIVFQR